MRATKTVRLPDADDGPGGVLRVSAQVDGDPIEIVRFQVL